MTFENALVLEEPSENRNLVQPGHPVFVVLIVDLINPGDHCRAAVPDQELSLRVAGDNRCVLAAGNTEMLTKTSKSRKTKA